MQGMAASQWGEEQKGNKLRRCYKRGRKKCRHGTKGEIRKEN
jgi:hypothetical protein